MAISLAKEDMLRFSLSRDHESPRFQRIMWLHRWVPLTKSPQPPILGGHRPCRRGDIKVSICHVTSRDHVIRESSDIMDEFPHHKSPLCQIWWPSVLQKMRYFVFNLSGDLLWPRGQRVPVIVSIHPVKFGGHRHCAREKILLFVCHVTTHDFVIRESYDMGEFSSSFMTTLQRLVIIDLLEDEILSFQFVTWFHVITWSEGHVTSWMSSPHHKSLPC